VDSEGKSAPRGERGEEKFSHVSVLSQEAIDFLAIRRGGTYLDATLGLGGHSYEIARRLGAQGHLIALDKDTNALEMARRRLSEIPEDLKADWPQITLLHASYADIAKHAKPKSLDGVLADLGISSMQLQDAGRGFSFQAEGPLDMRMDPHAELDAEQVVNHISERELADVIYEFGEERRSRRIARAICRARPIRTTAHLAQVISVVARPMNSSERRIHPATKTFQGIRIFVNHELDDLKELLAAAPSMLVPRGRLVVISFHSLEDWIVKDSMREVAQKGKYELLTKKPVTATEDEIDRNPRSRSAKLRAAARK